MASSLVNPQSAISPAPTKTGSVEEMLGVAVTRRGVRGADLDGVWVLVGVVDLVGVAEAVAVGDAVAVVVSVGARLSVGTAVKVGVNVRAGAGLDATKVREFAEPAVAPLTTAYANPTILDTMMPTANQRKFIFIRPGRHYTQIRKLFCRQVISLFTQNETYAKMIAW